MLTCGSIWYAVQTQLIGTTWTAYYAYNSIQHANNYLNREYDQMYIRMISERCGKMHTYAVFTEVVKVHDSTWDATDTEIPLPFVISYSQYTQSGTYKILYRNVPSESPKQESSPSHPPRT